MKPLILPKVSLGKLSHDELQVLLARLITEFEKQEEILPMIAMIIAELTQALTTHRNVLDRERSSELTQKIHELDELRDRAYKLLLRKIRTSQDEFDQALVDAGAYLLPVVDKFNSSITKVNYAEQTGLMVRALDEFKKPEYGDHHTVLGTLPYVDHAVTYNSEFEKVWNERSAIVDPDGDLPLMREVRGEIEKLSRLLLKNAQFLIDRNHATMSDSLASLLNTELEKMATLIKTRETVEENQESIAE